MIFRHTKKCFRLVIELEFSNKVGMYWICGES